VTFSTEPPKAPTRQPSVNRSSPGVALLTAAALALFAAACATTSEDELASEEERAAYASAIAQIPADREAGRTALEEFLRAWPRSPLADDAAYRLGKMALADGDQDEALRNFYYVVRHHPDRELADRARLEGAKLELQREDLEAARKLLADLDVDELDREMQLVAYELLAQVAEDPVDRLRWLNRTSELVGENPVAKLEIYTAIGAELAVMSVEDLLRAAELAGDQPIAERILFELAGRAVISRDLEGLEDAIARLEDLRLSEAGEQKIEELRERLLLLEAMGESPLLPTFAEAMQGGWRKVRASSGTLGVVLPLTGPFASYGEESLRGILLAAGIFDSPGTPTGSQVGEGARDVAQGWDPADPGAFDSPGDGLPTGPRIIVRDTGGDPRRAAAAVRELASNEDLVAIIGPLLAKECTAAANAAEQFEVPILTLTSRQEIPRNRDHVFRLRTTPDDEVLYLVEHAMGELGAQRFAILYPKDTFGLGMRERFWDAVEQRGGVVVAASSYDPKEVDFEQPIRDMIGYMLLTDAEKQTLKERKELLKRARRLDPEVAGVVREVAYSIVGPTGDPLPPIVDFDALFIPDSHDKVVLIAPQLVFHELERVQLLGSAGWNHPDLVHIARNHVRGAVISTPFHRESPLPFVRSFVEDYEATFGSPPDSYSAHAYDAVQLVFEQLAAGLDSREELREGTLRVSAYPGVSGVLTLLPDGNARKRPFLLRVRGGSFTPLDSPN
jgi:ABC-type branched-subunit amino acid transport system substrate-binding protein/predicted negative regulator of RcsB-dependent stress response